MEEDQETEQPDALAAVDEPAGRDKNKSQWLKRNRDLLPADLKALLDSAKRTDLTELVNRLAVKDVRGQFQLAANDPVVAQKRRLYKEAKTTNEAKSVPRFIAEQQAGGSDKLKAAVQRGEARCVKVDGVDYYTWREASVAHTTGQSDSMDATAEVASGSQDLMLCCLRSQASGGHTTRAFWRKLTWSLTALFNGAGR